MIKFLKGRKHKGRKHTYSPNNVKLSFFLNVGIPFVRVFATDADDPDTPNTQLSYSIESQIPNPSGVVFFTIDPNTGEISTTDEGTTAVLSVCVCVYVSICRSV